MENDNKDNEKPAVDSSPPESPVTPITPPEPTPEVAPETPTTAPAVPSPATPAPVATTPGSTAPVSGVIEQPKKKGVSKKLMAIVAGLLVLILGGGFFVYATILNSPEMKLAKAVENLIRSEETATTTDIEIKADGISANVNLNTYYNASPLVFNINTELDVLATKVGLDVLIIDGSAYMRVEGIKEFAPFVSQGLGPEAAGPVEELMTSLDGQWIEIQESLIASSGVDLDSFVSQINQNAQNLTLENDLFTIVEELEGESVNGTDTLKLVVRQNELGVLELFEKLFAGVELAGETADTDELRSELEKAFEEEDLLNSELTVWIDLADDTFEQVRLEADEDGSEVDVTLNYLNPAEIDIPEKPTDVISLLELYALISEAGEGLGFDVDELTSGLGGL